MARPSSNLTENLRVRLSPDEKVRLVADAERAAVDVSTMARAQLLDAPLPRKARRAATGDEKSLARLLGAVNKLGGNINQLSKVANTERTVSLEAVRVIAAAADEVARFRAEIRDAMTP